MDIATSTAIGMVSATMAALLRRSARCMARGSVASAWTGSDASPRDARSFLPRTDSIRSAMPSDRGTMIVPNTMPSAHVMNDGPAMAM